MFQNPTNYNCLDMIHEWRLTRNSFSASLLHDGIVPELSGSGFVTLRVHHHEVIIAKLLRILFVSTGLLFNFHSRDLLLPSTKCCCHASQFLPCIFSSSILCCIRIVPFLAENLIDDFMRHPLLLRPFSRRTRRSFTQCSTIDLHRSQGMTT